MSCFAPAVVTKSQACKFVEENARYTDQEVDMMEALERCVLVESNFGQSGHIMRTSCAHHAHVVSATPHTVRTLGASDRKIAHSSC